MRNSKQAEYIRIYEYTLTEMLNLFTGYIIMYVWKIDPLTWRFRR